MCDVVRQNQHNTAKQLSSNKKKKKSLLLANGPFLFLQNVSPQPLSPLLQLLFLFNPLSSSWKGPCDYNGHTQDISPSQDS